jgi:hypothetical protein
MFRGTAVCAPGDAPTTHIRPQLQLLGFAALNIAAKFDAVYSVPSRDLLHVATSPYTWKTVLRFEVEVLNAIRFELNAPTALHFLRFFSHRTGSSVRTHALARFVAELSLVSGTLAADHPPSCIAAASLYVARRVLGVVPLWVRRNVCCDSWITEREQNAEVAQHTGYGESDLLGCARALRILMSVRGAGPTAAIRRKYESPALFSVAAIAPGALF